MKGDLLNGAYHAARHCSPRDCDKGSLQATAFYPTDKDPYPSVNCLEMTGASSRIGQLQELLRIFRAKPRTVRPSHHFAVLNVGAAVAKVSTQSQDSIAIAFVHQPEEADETHAEIFGLHNLDQFRRQIVAELLVEEAIRCGIYKAADIDAGSGFVGR